LTLGWLVLAAVALAAHLANAATLINRARLREGPSKETTLLGWLDVGTVVAIEGERNGWYAVRTPDGQTGYVWRDHLRLEPSEAAPGAEGVVTTMPPATAVPPPAAPAPAPAALPSPVAPPAADVRSPAPERVDAIVTELERMRIEVARLATAQQELAQRVGRLGREGPGANPIATDGSAGAAVLFFGGGAFVGWLLGRLTAGRRERRSRIRL
jgi:uncharacterized protein YgiM (DUF1202 family)